MFGVHLFTHLMMVISIMYPLLMTLQGSHGYFPCKAKVKFHQFLISSTLMLNANSILTLKVFKLTLGLSTNPYKIYFNQLE